ncbi:MAG: VOC family protein, partial [Wenzhouxiangella sp.]
MNSGRSDIPRPVLDRIHHLAFITADLDRAVARFERLLGVTMAERGPVAGRGAEVAIFKLANLNLEVVSPVQPDSPLHDYLARHG